jgi:hypothetical protein
MEEWQELARIAVAERQGSPVARRRVSEALAAGEEARAHRPVRRAVAWLTRAGVL